jgi:hypothetical protein
MVMAKKVCVEILICVFKGFKIERASEKGLYLRESRHSWDNSVLVQLPLHHVGRRGQGTP